MVNNSLKKVVSVIVVIALLFSNAQMKVSALPNDVIESGTSIIEGLGNKENSIIEEEPFNDGNNNDLKNKEDEEKNEQVEEEEKESYSIEGNSGKIDITLSTSDNLENNERLEEIENNDANETLTISEISDTTEKNETSEIDTKNETTMSSETSISNEISESDEIKTISQTIQVETNNIKATDVIIATNSQAAIVENEFIESIATNSNVDNYASLDTLAQLTYLNDAAAKKVDDKIILLEDINLYDEVKFTDDLNLDLAGHSITAADNKYALFIENNFILYDSVGGGSIKNKTPNVPTLYVKNATIELKGGSILGVDGPKGSNCITVINSDLTIDGATIIAGNGIDSDEKQGGRGGNAIEIKDATSNNHIHIISGTIKGGNGGKGIGDRTPVVGTGVCYNGTMQGGKGVGKGSNGEKGGGDGGFAINIKTKEFKLKNLSYEAGTLFAGSAGSSLFKDHSDIKLFGDGSDLPHYYSLYDLNGKNYLTSLKDQSSQGLCAIFAMCAEAETYMMKRFPDYVKNVLGKVTSKARGVMPSRDEELNLSEFYFAMSIHKPPTDAFGNAGHSDALSEANRSRWADDIGSTSQNQVSLASTWRGFVLENDSISDKLPRTSQVQNYMAHPVSQAVTDSYANETKVHAKNMKIYSATDYVDNATIAFDQERYVADMKKAIVDYDGVFLGYYLSSYRSVHFISNGTDYGNCYIFYCDKTMNSYSGHGMYCIGWDDDYEYSFYASGATRSGRGVFILKNSWDGFALIPYDYNWVNWFNTNDYTTFPVMTSEYIAAEFMPAFYKYENNYFYDAGVGGVSKVSNVAVSKNIEIPALGDGTKTIEASISYKKALNVFKIRNDKEKALAVSFYANAIGRTYEAALYRVPNDNNAMQIASALTESNKLVSKTFTTHHGVNVIDFDTPVDVLKGQYIAVVITSDEDSLGRTWVDAEGIEEIDLGDFYHTPDIIEKSFWVAPTVEVDAIYRNGIDVTNNPAITNDFVEQQKQILQNEYQAYKILDANLRIKLWTNNYVRIDTGEYGNIGGSTTTYFYPTLKASMSDLPTPTAVNNGKRFVNYIGDNVNKSGEDNIAYDKNSIYSLDIAGSLKLVAQYEDVEEQTTEATQAPTQTPTAAPTQAPTTAPTTTRTYNGGNNGGGGGGGGGGGTLPAIAPAENAFQSIYVNNDINKNNISISMLQSTSVVWNYDAVTNKWKLNANDTLGNPVNVKNGFYQIPRSINTGYQQTNVIDTYYFDASGNMVTGIMQSADNNLYYFEKEKNLEEGKMAIGWKKIDGYWYYFSNDGTMLKSNVTPDGYLLGDDGRLILDVATNQ